MLKPLNVVAAIIERHGKILLARRAEGGDQPGLWEFPGGKVEPGETQPEALVRELREEMGITARPGTYVASHQQEVSGRLINLHAWHVQEYQEEMVAYCHSELAWCEPSQALEYAMQHALAPADIPLLHAFMALRDATPAD